MWDEKEWWDALPLGLGGLIDILGGERENDAFALVTDTNSGEKFIYDPRPQRPESSRFIPVVVNPDGTVVGAAGDLPGDINMVMLTDNEEFMGAVADLGTWAAAQPIGMPSTVSPTITSKTPDIVSKTPATASNAARIPKKLPLPKGLGVMGNTNGMWSVQATTYGLAPAGGSTFNVAAGTFNEAKWLASFAPKASLSTKFGNFVKGAASAVTKAGPWIDTLSSVTSLFVAPEQPARSIEDIGYGQKRKDDMDVKDTVDIIVSLVGRVLSKL